GVLSVIRVLVVDSISPVAFLAAGAGLRSLGASDGLSSSAATGSDGASSGVSDGVDSHITPTTPSTTTSTPARAESRLARNDVGRFDIWGEDACLAIGSLFVVSGGDHPTGCRGDRPGDRLVWDKRRKREKVTDKTDLMGPQPRVNIRVHHAIRTIGATLTTGVVAGPATPERPPTRPAASSEPRPDPARSGDRGANFTHRCEVRGHQ